MYFGVSDFHSLYGVSDSHTATLLLRSESKGRVLATEEVRTKSVALIPEGVEAAVRSPCPAQADGRSCAQYLLRATVPNKKQTG